ncbi:phage portal protein [Companilactobacillus allii]|nr:phage portal protein [Companilactobacillus allii]USQ67660.1 phage portal protein [Companilactobacillus allii]
MGLIKSIESVSDVSNLLIDDGFLKNINLWNSAYKGDPFWIHKHWTSALNIQHDHTQKSLNMPKILSKKMASLVFNQKATINVNDKKDSENDETSPEQWNNDANEFVQEVLQDNYFYNNCERYLEYMFGTGGMVMRFYVANGKVKIRFATADAFYPISQDENGVTECVIASKFIKSGKSYTLLEWHLEDDSSYIIKNDLYQSVNDSTDDLGTKVELSTIYGKTVKPRSSYPKGLYSRPTFVYIKPNLANNFNYSSPLGISIYANAIDTLKQLDQAYDMLNQEMEMGRRRITVPDSMLEGKINPVTGQRESNVNFDERVYVGFSFNDTSGTDSAPAPKDITLGLRNQEIIGTINSLLDILAAQCGFSAGTFSYNNTQGMETATGVISRNSDTYQSKNSHETILEDAFKNMCISILELGKAAGLYQGSTDVEVSVNFDDSIAKDRTENANYYELVSGNKPLMPHFEAIKKSNGLTDDEAIRWLKQIREDEADGDIEDILDNHKDKEDET